MKPEKTMIYIGTAPSVQNEIWSPVTVTCKYKLDDTIRVNFKRPDGLFFTYNEITFLRLYKPFIEPNKIWKDLNES